jgi:hypothetical protein
MERNSLRDGRHVVVCYFYDLNARQLWAAVLLDDEERLRLTNSAKYTHPAATSGCRSRWKALRRSWRWPTRASASRRECSIRHRRAGSHRAPPHIG